MSRYSEDGSPLPSKVPMSQKRGANEHGQQFGVYRGIVVKTVYPDDPANSNGQRMEYAVKVRGQVYPNALNMKEAGGIYNYKERVRKHVEKAFNNKLEEGTYDENLDGEYVYVMFVESNGNVPLIIGSADHPRRPAYNKILKADGIVDIEEFNGVEFLIDKDGNYTIKQVGLKDKEGAIQNQAAVDSQIKMHSNGDIEFNTHGTDGMADLRMKFTKADKKAEIFAQNNQAVLDASGILLKDKNDNEVKLESGLITINTSGTAKFTGEGGTEVGAASSATQVKGSTVALAGGGAPVARLGDQAIGIGNMGAPVVSNITQGSPKVTSG